MLIIFHDMLIIPYLFVKCLKYCGCGNNGQCNYCNSSYFIGYTPTNSEKKYFFNQTSQVTPNTNGKSCTQNSKEAINVSFQICLFF